MLILIGFSIINHPFWGTPIFGNTHIERDWFHKKNGCRFQLSNVLDVVIFFQFKNHPFVVGLTVLNRLGTFCGKALGVTDVSPTICSRALNLVQFAVDWDL